MMNRLILVCMVLVFGVSLAVVEPVAACSGGSYRYGSLGWSLGSYEIFVAGRIHALSDSGFNAVLQVDQIIQGDTLSKFIIFHRDSPIIIAEGRGLPPCQYEWGPRLPMGKRFIAGLWHTDSGVYDGSLFIETDDDMFLLDNPDQRIETLTFTYDEAVDFIAQRLKTTPYSPLLNTKPRPVVVELTTIARDTYRLAADQTTFIKLPSMSSYHCSSYDRTCLNAPNGVDTVWFHPLGSNPERNMMNLPFISNVEGTTGVFSPQSDLLTIWVGQRLDIYATALQRGLAQTSDYGMASLKSLDFDVNDPLIPGAGAWDHDGRIFAFSSEAGVWFWDALRPETEPTLFLANKSGEKPLVVRHFSPAGHYLALETLADEGPPSRRYNIEIATQQEYPDGLFSPDDRVLAAYDTLARRITPLMLYRVLPVLEPVWQTNYGPLISQFEWIDPTTYLYAACGMPILGADAPAGFEQPWCKVRRGQATIYDKLEWTDGFLFDYDPITNSLATVMDSDTISINGEIIELEGQVDSTIANITLTPLIDLDYRNY